MNANSVFSNSVVFSKYLFLDNNIKLTKHNHILRQFISYEIKRVIVIEKS